MNERASTYVMISQEDYATLVKAEERLDIVYKIAKADDSAFGYTDHTAKMIDTILDIKRNEK